MSGDRRRPHLELALRHLHDIREPSPKAPSMRAEAGFAPTRRVPCPDCGHLDEPGWRIDKFSRRVSPCYTCGGTLIARAGNKTYTLDHTSFPREPPPEGTAMDVPDGVPGARMEWKPGTGVIAIDPMDSHRAAIGSADTKASARPERMVKCDACQDAAGEPTGMFRGERCPYCKGRGKRPLHVFNLAIDTREQDAILDHVQRQVDQRAKDRSWVELETAMARLKREKWNSWRLVHRVYVIRVLRVEDVYGRTGAGLSYETLENGMQYLLWRLPEDWTAPAGLRANEKLLRDRRTRARGRGQEVGRRDKEIREHAKAGRSPQWIAAEYGLSVRTVYEVVNGKREESAA